MKGNSQDSAERKSGCASTASDGTATQSHDPHQAPPVVMVADPTSKQARARLKIKLARQIIVAALKHCDDLQVTVHRQKKNGFGDQISITDLMFHHEDGS